MTRLPALALLLLAGCITVEGRQHQLYLHIDVCVLAHCNNMADLGGLFDDTEEDTPDELR